jgi:hypothetical protein
MVSSHRKIKIRILSEMPVKKPWLAFISEDRQETKGFKPSAPANEFTGPGVPSYWLAPFGTDLIQ